MTELEQITQMANEHARRDMHASGQWTCLGHACRAQRAIDDAEGLGDLMGKILTGLYSGTLPTVQVSNLN